MAFTLAKLPRIEFGTGCAAKLPAILAGYGKRLLLVTGASSFTESDAGHRTLGALKDAGFSWEIERVAGEPSPELVDAAVRRRRDEDWSAVLGVGGGSVLDAAKAIAGLLRPGNTVLDHLEGVGPELPYQGPATPFIAVPTTAGTGSEATKNAVLSRMGPDGFKKSFRDDKLVAEWAVVDPDLLASCPLELIAADGMDAFTQLLESFVSTRSNPFTEALVRSGLEAVRNGLLSWYDGGPCAAAGREQMAYASLISGIALAQTGLGSVHGLASPLGAFFPIPHGVVCGTLVAAASRVNIEVMASRDPENTALGRYAEAGRILGADLGLSDTEARGLLLELLESWTQTLQLPRLSSYEIREGDFPHILAHSRGSSMKTNPIVLTDAELERVLEARL